MDKEQIEKAANNYIECLLEGEIDYTLIDDDETTYETGKCDALSRFGKDIFTAGADWRINSVWHDLKDELPECNKHVVNEDWFDFEAKDEKDFKRILKKYPFKRWAYVEDLLPTKDTLK